MKLYAMHGTAQAAPTCLVAFGVLAGMAAPVYAAGFHLHEQGTALVGSASVGQAALADDASTAYFNPAGMTRLQGNELLLGAQYLDLTVVFEKNNNSTVSGGNGGDAGGAGATASMFYVHSLSPDLKAGISMTAPFGLTLQYDRDWAGRYYVTDAALQTVNLNPSLGYRVNNWLSVGGGASVQYTHYYARQAVNNVLDGGADGSADFDIDGVDYGFNLGVMVEPQPGSRIGLAYRSGITTHLEGDTQFYDIGPTLVGAGLTGTEVSSDVKLPATALLSAYQQVTPQLALLGELGWENWSILDTSVLKFNGGLTDVTVRNWHDTYRMGVGLRYEYGPDWTLMSGVSYDTSPVNTPGRTPDLPNDAQLRFGAGVQYDIAANMKVGLGYTFVDLNKPPIDVNKSGLTGRLAGQYFEHLHFVAVNMSWKF